MQKNIRKHLSAPGLLNLSRLSFNRVKEIGSSRSNLYSLSDCLMSGLAIFGLKSPSLLDFYANRTEEVLKHNLKHLYGVEQVPCDTRLKND